MNRSCLVGLATIALAFLGGCQRANPSFPVMVEQARYKINQQMKEDPQPLQRPLVVVVRQRFMHSSTRLEKQLRVGLSDDRIMTVALHRQWSFDRCREELIEAVDDRFPGDDSQWTTEVDVVGHSIGGLVALYAADSSVGDRHLRIGRLFTLSTPMQGFGQESMEEFDELLVDMNADPALVASAIAQGTSADYEIIPYTRLTDKTSGEANNAPPGEVAWWLPARPLDPSHDGARNDPRIQADIMRRLRNEEPLTTTPRAPLPPAEDES